MNLLDFKGYCMKMAIDWHKQCLANWAKNLERDQAELARKIAAVERNKCEIAFYNKQIITAEAKKMDGFDCERFMLKEKEPRLKANL